MIYVRELERALEFYQDIVGFKLLTKEEDYTRLQSPKGESTIALHKSPELSASGILNEGIQLYFEVPDLEVFCENLLSRAGFIQANAKAHALGMEACLFARPRRTRAQPVLGG